VLSALTLCAAVTALIAGIAGAWSPCGLSMLDTIGSTLGDTRRWVLLMAVSAFALGAIVGGIVTFGGLALAGTLFGGEATLRDALAGAIALAAAVADWRGVRIAPQIRRQVPERWRWIMPLPLACALYGVLLGLGFTTFVLAFAVWALAAISIALDNVTLGLLVGVAFGVGRALPIVWLAPGLRTADGQRRLDRIAIDVRLWLGMRRLGALGLTLCAVAIGTTSAFGHSVPPRLVTIATAATDPSVDGSLVAWQEVGGSGVLQGSTGATGATTPLPGDLPALGGSNAAWEQGDEIVVANAATLSPQVTIPLPAGATLSALAVSDSWLVVSDLPAGGGADLLAISLSDPGTITTIAQAPLAGEIGRPVIDGSDVVFARGGPSVSQITEIDLVNGTKTRLRWTRANHSFLNPVLANGQLLYEQVGRCAQELLLGSPDGASNDKLLLSISSTVRRDPGYQRGYQQAWNTASVCANRSAGPGGKITLGTTALGTSAAYVTEYPANVTDSRIVTVSLNG
jgi:hypothetical protein